jgi:hypothetical protein
MYNVYKLSYKRPIFNSFAIITQLTDFFDVAIYLLIRHIYKGIVA